MRLLTVNKKRRAPPWGLRGQNMIMMKAFFVTVVCLAAAVAGQVDSECQESLSSDISGDPHVVGYHGQKFDFDGLPHRVFNMISEKSLQLNARFLPNQKWTGQTVIGEVGILVGDGHERLHATCSNSTLRVLVDGSELEPNVPAVLSDGTVATLSGHTSHVSVRIQSGPHTLTLKQHKTRQLACFIDIEAQYMVSQVAQALEGILGRTADSQMSIPTAADIELFMVKSDDIFGSDFPVSLYSPLTAGKVRAPSRRSILAAEVQHTARRILNFENCGCMNDTALNYDATALYSDGSCVYIDNSSTTASIILTGDCNALTEADLIEAIAQAMGIPMGDITVDDITCSTTLRHTQLRRLRVLESSTIEVTFTVPEEDKSSLDSFLDDPRKDTLLAVTGVNSVADSYAVRYTEDHPWLRERFEEGLGLIDPCRTIDGGTHCGENASCRPHGKFFECLCPSSTFSGVQIDGTCEVRGTYDPRLESQAPADPCSPNPCTSEPNGMNNCINILGSAECYGADRFDTCAPGSCGGGGGAAGGGSTSVCDSRPCMFEPNGYTNCLDVGGRAACYIDNQDDTCEPGMCRLKPAGCFPNPCANEPFGYTHCTPLPAGPVCYQSNVTETCIPGSCQLTMDPCNPNPCADEPFGYNVCQLRDNAPLCFTSNYLGTPCTPGSCSVASTQCADNPCANEPYGYTNCYPHIGGVRCYKDSIEDLCEPGVCRVTGYPCDPNPCVNEPFGYTSCAVINDQPLCHSGDENDSCAPGQCDAEKNPCIGNPCAQQPNGFTECVASAPANSSPHAMCTRAGDSSMQCPPGECEFMDAASCGTWTGRYLDACTQETNPEQCIGSRYSGGYCNWNGAECVAVQSGCTMYYPEVDCTSRSFKSPFPDSSEASCLSYWRTARMNLNGITKNYKVGGKYSVATHTCILAACACPSWSGREVSSCESVATEELCEDSRYAKGYCKWNQNICTAVVDNDCTSGERTIDCSQRTFVSAAPYSRTEERCLSWVTNRKLYKAGLGLVTEKTGSVWSVDTNTCQYRKCK